VATPSELLTRELRRDGSRPFITWYGAAAGERVELSIATTANWVAKIAGYVDDELDIYSDDPIVVDPTLHWITAVALLGVWQTGAAVTTDLDAGELFELPLDPMGMGLSRLVGAYPDSYAAIGPSGADAVAVAPELPAGARLLTTLSLDDPGWGLLSPLVASGSVVYSPADAPGLAERAATERVTHTAGIDLPGMPRLD
jgi:hypothetical protein